MTASPEPPRGPNEPRKIQPARDANADADPPYLGGRGTEPQSSSLADTAAERRKAPRGTAQTSKGIPGMVWVVVAVIAIAVAVYLFVL